MRDSSCSRWFAIFIVTLTVPAFGLTQDVDEEAEDSAALTEEEPIELASQTVTGSRLISGDPSARVYSLSAEDIAVRGVSSLEDLFRTLPWAFPSITTQSNMTYGGGNGDTDKSLGIVGLGASTVNLRALGSANTLVLVNGRRVAGLAGDEDSLTNILNVPLSAIDRVDIQLDGASAVYGADAIGGVVNFITKKNYQGLSATYREEFSSTDSDRRNISIQGGYAWGNGNVTANVSRNGSKPINNFKIWTSSDFRDEYGPEYDKRLDTISQPGIVCEFNGSYTFPRCRFGAPKLQLPAGHSGVGATADDFSTDIAPGDYVLPQNGEDSTITSYNLRVEQYLSDEIRLYADLLVSNSDSYQEFITRMSNYLVGANNPYNPFGRTMLVSYWPIYELETGLIPHSYTEADNEQRNFNAGLFWEIGGDHQFELKFTRSESERVTRQIRTDWRRSEFEPASAKFFSVVESTDPSVALNLFGNGTAQSPGFIELFTKAWGNNYGFSEVTSYEPLLRGQLFRIWGGPISYAVGGEVRKEIIHGHSEVYIEGGTERRYGRGETIGVERPTEDLTAYFAEFALPVVGQENARPGLRSLVLSLQARRDTYKATGASGGVTSVLGSGTSRAYAPGQGWIDVPGYSFTPDGAPNIIETSKSVTSPRIGLQYMPSQTLTARAAWSKSFQPPVFSDQFNLQSPRTFPGYYIDPYHPDGSLERVRPPVVFASFNPDIKSEFAEKYSLGFEWSSQSIPGLRWTVDWSRVEFTNKIEYAIGLLSSEPEVAFALPSIIERDANGYISQINGSTVNIAEKVSEILETHVEFGFETNIGSFTPRLSYTRVLDEYFSVTLDSEPIERVGTATGSNEYKLVGSLTWTWGRFAADLFVHHIPSYENDRVGSCLRAVGRCPYQYAALPSLKVDALTTVDLTLTYVFDNGLRLRGGGRNIFDEDLRTVWQSYAYDPTRWDARGQVLYVELNWEM